MLPILGPLTADVSIEVRSGLTSIRILRRVSEVEFIEASAFTKLLDRYMDDDEYRLFQEFLAASPEAGDFVQGTGGFRKVRWADKRRSKGKRGGLRVIYHYFDEHGLIWL